ncbi:MAG: hypothetical protein KIT48_12665 [Pseudolabrys sp.]|nr:hypothetical protein [Pseudolabrys sp.]
MLRKTAVNKVVRFLYDTLQVAQVASVNRNCVDCDFVPATKSSKADRSDFACSLMSPLVSIARDYIASRIVIVECAYTHLGLQAFLMMTIVSVFAARVAQRSQLQ